MISLQVSLIRIKFDSTFDARESNAAFVTCDSNQMWPLTVFDHSFDVAQRRLFVQWFWSLGQWVDGNENVKNAIG